MKTQFFYFVICLILINCQESNPELAYKYSDKPDAINCNTKDLQLFNEAIYSFEENLIKNFTNQNTNLDYAYHTFLKETFNNTLNLNSFSNEHSLEVFEALKQIEGLWVMRDNQLSLNYNHDIFNCIAKQLDDKDLKTTYNALLSTNSLSMRMLKDVIMRRSRSLNSDKYLATYVILELYYSKLSDVDLSKKQDLPNETKLKEKKDPHAGHNHD